MEKHFVYIIYSSRYNVYYKGYSTKPFERLIEHNNNKSRYTKSKGPWEIVYIELSENKNKALLREMQLNKYTHAYILVLIKSPNNLLNN